MWQSIVNKQCSHTWGSIVGILLEALRIHVLRCLLWYGPGASEGKFCVGIAFLRRLRHRPKTKLLVVNSLTL